MVSGRGAPARGRFVVVEGPEGAGKSTQLEHLRERLAEEGRQTLFTREPGGTPAGEAIRTVVLDPGLRVDPLAEFLLYSAARAQHVAEVIEPALSAGQDVISDRFTAASVAYQGHGRGLDLGLIDQINRLVTAELKPDLTVLLDIEPSVGLRRASERSDSDRLESAGLDFHERVRAGFLAQARAGADGRWRVIDASQPPAAVGAALWQAVEAVLAAGREHG